MQIKKCASLGYASEFPPIIQRFSQTHFCFREANQYNRRLPNMRNEVDSRFFRLRANSPAEMRLFCFPSAGGGVAQLYSWFKGLPSNVEMCPIQLSGREERRQEPPIRRMDVLVAAVADALEPALKMPYALFGHSLGALVAFELARELRRRRLPPPARLFVSSRDAPQLPPRFSPIHHLPDAEFIERLAARYGPIPPAILSEPELMNMFLPVLRSDMEILETYSYRPELPLELDLSVFGGTSDPSVDKIGLSSWAEQTSLPLAIRMFPGDHFFPRVAREDFLKATSRDLAESLRKHTGC